MLCSLLQLLTFSMDTVSTSFLLVLVLDHVLTFLFVTFMAACHKKSLGHWPHQRHGLIPVSFSQAASPDPGPKHGFCPPRSLILDSPIIGQSALSSVKRSCLYAWLMPPCC